MSYNLQRCGRYHRSRGNSKLLKYGLGLSTNNLPCDCHSSTLTMMFHANYTIYQYTMEIQWLSMIMDNLFEARVLIFSICVDHELVLLDLFLVYPFNKIFEQTIYFVVLKLHFSASWLDHILNCYYRVGSVGVGNGFLSLESLCSLNGIWQWFN